MDLLGSIVMFKKTLYMKGLGTKFPQVKKGAIANILMVSSEPEGLELIVNIDGDLHHFDHQGFYTYCKVLKGNINYVCAV
jgi:hypothetical protein